MQRARVTQVSSQMIQPSKKTVLSLYAKDSATLTTECAEKQYTAHQERNARNEHQEALAEPPDILPCTCEIAHEALKGKVDH